VCWSGAGSKVSRPKPVTSNGYFHGTRAGRAVSPEHISHIPQAAEKRSTVTVPGKQINSELCKAINSLSLQETVEGVPSEEHLTAVKTNSCKTATLNKEYRNLIFALCIIWR
jgi:hypothetical protein